MTVIPSRALLSWDLRLMWRYGLVYAAAFVSFMWVAVLMPVPSEVVDLLLPVALLTDLSLFGLFFLAGMLFLEKDERTLQALVVTPLRPTHYLLSKAVGLTIITTAATIAVVGLLRGTTVNWPLLLVAVVLNSLAFTLAGFAAAARFRSIAEFLLPAAAMQAIVFLPIVGYFGLLETPLWYLFPSQALLVLMTEALQPGTAAGWELVYGLAYSIAFVVLSMVAAKRVFVRFVVEGGSPGRLPARSVATPTSRSDRAGPAQGKAPAMATRDGSRPGALRALVTADIRNIARDPMLAFFAPYPLILVLAARWLVPFVRESFLHVFDMEPYYPLVLAMVSLAFVPGIFGAIMGFMLLDERDEGSLTALRVTPLGLGRYGLYRLFGPVLLSVLFSCVAFLVVGLVDVPLVAAFPAAAIAALTAPVVALFTAAFAGNKVEGFALMKGIGVIYLAPVIAFLVPMPWQLVLGLAPTYWSSKVFWMALDGQTGVAYWAAIAVGLAYHLVAIRWLRCRFERKL